MTPPLRRTRGDLIATGVIAALSVAAVAGVIATAPVNDSELYPAESSVSEDPLATPPDQLTEAFTLRDTELPGQHAPVTVGDLTVVTDGHNVTAHDPTGREVWRYERDREICTIADSWGNVTVTYRNNAGCGDVVSIDGQTGQYNATRSAPATNQVLPVSSNDRVGTLSSERVELWRSDLVRTVRYGEVEAPQEPGSQPTEDCEITSALTRTDLLATTENCPDGTWLRLQETTPEDARQPELIEGIQLPSPEARLVAVGEEAAAVHVPGPEARIESFDTTGNRISRTPAPAVELPAPYAPATADLPHHMSWFDGERLYLLTPTELRVDHVLEDAIGTGVAVGESLLYPTADGIAVADPTTGETRRTLPVERDSATAALSRAGGTIVEKRGDTLVGLRQAP